MGIERVVVVVAGQIDRPEECGHSSNIKTIHLPWDSTIYTI